MQIEAVVFDMDGLMLDTEPLYKAAWQRASADLGHELDDLSYVKLVGRPTPDCEAALLAQFGSGFPLDRFRARWPELWQAGVAETGIAAKPGLFELLEFLDDHGVPRAVATSSEADYAEFSLRRAGLDGRFSVVVTGDQIQRGKPAPDIYAEAAARLGVKPERCVALEDSEAGILAAAAAGMIAVLIPDWAPPSEVAVRAAFRVLASLTEVPTLLEPFVGDKAR
jgi:HAD superfamily hydrolase (TIGR01509 family)